jgi:hypothetical protein
VLTAGGATTSFGGLARKTQGGIARRERRRAVGETGTIGGSGRAGRTAVKVAFNLVFAVKFLEMREGDMAKTLVIKEQLFLGAG